MNLLKKHIIPLFLIWIFLTPLVVQFIHRHEHYFHCTAKNEAHLRIFHEKCPICAFHFSNFTSEYKYFKIAEKEVYRRVTCSYITIFTENPYDLSLLLRGPPVTNDLV
jgi:hypothetical protein